jgi:hypothetical protein
MHSGTSWSRTLALAALASALTLPLRSNAAVSISGPTSAAPGETISLAIDLGTALEAGIDELSLQLSFDATVLSGQEAAAGPVLASGSFVPNASTGAATHSFLSTLATLGPGTLATWTFQISPSAIPQTTTVIGATLMTFVIDDVLTAEMSSAPFTITVVPEPSVWASLLAGIAALGALRRRQLHRARVA